jgi:hypothetical protein
MPRKMARRRREQGGYAEKRNQNRAQENEQKEDGPRPTHHAEENGMRTENKRMERGIGKQGGYAEKRKQKQHNK